MSKRPNLAAVAAAAGCTRRPQVVATGATIAMPPEAVSRVTARPRLRTKPGAAPIPEDVAWQLRALAVERKTTVQNLMAEALNDLFAKYGKPEVAPVEREGRGS